MTTQDRPGPPTPWVASLAGDTYWLRDADGKTILYRQLAGEDSERTGRVFDLIAAAPETAQELRRLIVQIDRMDKAGMFRARSRRREMLVSNFAKVVVTARAVLAKATEEVS